MNKFYVIQIKTFDYKTKNWIWKDYQFHSSLEKAEDDHNSYLGSGWETANIRIVERIEKVMTSRYK